MSIPPGSITVSQLLYTNVEADKSPARQRGFQVWLCSPELTPEQRKAIARRVEDFRLPPGASDTAIARHAFFRIPGPTPDALSLFGIARTVPLTEKDKFGRGGKFHAHVVVLSDAAFRQLGCNPFRLIDGGFAFHSHPNEAMDEAGRWKSGTLDPVTITPAELGDQTADLPAEQLVLLLNHAERTDMNPVVVAEPPERLLALLRECFRVFPPAARRRLEFDTLSTGAFLAQVKYVVVGAFSVPMLKMWSFRRYHKLDLATRTFTPPLEQPTTVLPVELIAAPGWRELSDAEQDALYDEGRRVAMLQLDEIRAEMLTPAAGAVLNACKPAKLAVQSAAEARAKRDVPAGLARLPGVVRAVNEHLSGPPAAAICRLATPVPRQLLALALLTDLGQPGVAPVPEVLLGLKEWLASAREGPNHQAPVSAGQGVGEGSVVQRLELIERRWRGTEADLAEIESILANPNADPETATWLRDWVGATLVPQVRDDRDALAARMSAGEPVPAEAVRDARLWLALGEGAGTPAWVELKLLTALQKGSETLLRVVIGPPRLENWDGWLLKTAAARLQGRFSPGWASDGLGNTYLGLFVVPGTRVEEVLLDAIVTVAQGVSPTQRSELFRRLLKRLWPGSEPSKDAPQADASTQPDAPEPANKLYQKLLEDPKKPAQRALQEHLIRAEDESFRWVGNQLLQRGYGERIVEPLSDVVTFIGLKLGWVMYDSKGAMQSLFEAVAGALVPEVPMNTVPEVGTELERRPARRFSWLLARLASPNTTERLKV